MSDRQTDQKLGKYRILVKVLQIFGNDASQAFDAGGERTMAKSTIAYQKDLAEIPSGQPSDNPIQHLVKDNTAPTGWQFAEGRRQSRLLLVLTIREAVDRWPEDGQPRASDVTGRFEG